MRQTHPFCHSERSVSVVEESDKMGLKLYYVYMMTNWNNSVLYVGVTGNLVRRVAEHINKEAPSFTQKYNLNKLVYYEEFSDVRQAIYREKQLKGWNRSKKNGLVNNFNPEWKNLYLCVL